MKRAVSRREENLIKILLKTQQSLFRVKMRHMVLSQACLLGILLENKAEILIDRPRLIRLRLPKEGKLLLMILKAIDNIPEMGIRDRDIIRRNPDDRAIFLVQVHQVPVPSVTHDIVPTIGIRELAQEWTGDILCAERTFQVGACPVSKCQDKDTKEKVEFVL